MSGYPFGIRLAPRPFQDAEMSTAEPGERAP
jgi:hypothetical protein